VEEVRTVRIKRRAMGAENSPDGIHAAGKMGCARVDDQIGIEREKKAESGIRVGRRKKQKLTGVRGLVGSQGGGLSWGGNAGP